MQDFRAAVSALVRRAGRAARPGRQVNWVMADQALVSGSNFLIGVVVARALGIEAFGVFSIAWTLVLFFYSLQTAMVLSPMTSVGPKQGEGAAGGYYAVVTLHQVTVAGVFAALTFLGCQFAPVFGLPDETRRLGAPLAAVVFFVQIHEFLRRYNITIGEAERVAVSDVARHGSFFGLLSILLLGVHAVLGVDDVLALVALSAALASATLLLRPPPFRGADRRFREVTARHLQISRWLVGSTPMVWITGNFALVTAGAVLGPAAAGALRASYSLMAITNIFFQAAESFVPARAARTYHLAGRAGLASFTRRVLLVGLTVTVMACAFLGLPGDFWLRIVFGEEYVGHGAAVLAYGLHFIIVAGMLPLRFAMQAVEETRPDFVANLLAATVSLTATYPLAIGFGVTGVAASVGLAHAVTLLYLAWAYRRFMRAPA